MKTYTEEELIRCKITDYLVDNSFPTISDVKIFDYLATKGSVDKDKLARSYGADKFEDWFQLANDAKAQEIERWK